jgi:hypothetical protein
MLVAYILTKSRYLKIKLVKDNSGIFRYKDFEYTIKRDRIYGKKFLGLKHFFFAFYLEGHSEPIEFKEDSYNLIQSEVPLDEIAYLMRKIRNGILDILMVIISAVTLITVIAIAIKVFEVVE